jgi:hypothetical protein
LKNLLVIGYVIASSIHYRVVYYFKGAM